MLSTKDLTNTLKKNESKLKALHVKQLFVFGSFAKGSAKPGSDIDFLVEFSKPVSMFEFLDLKYFLEDIFSSEVDLATEKALHPRLKDHILKEAIRVA
jgi:predicted nucleotidyltransferase